MAEESATSGPPEDSQTAQRAAEKESEDAKPFSALERKTAFMLTALLLASLVSISFFNLDRHPSFPPISEKMVAGINTTETPVIFALDPVSLAALEKRRHDLQPSILPLTTWPPEGPVLAFDASQPRLVAASMERRLDKGIWTLWIPRGFAPLPFFGLATVELEGADGKIEICTPDVQGGHQCGDAGWTRMRRRDVTIDGESQTCIWAHPIAEKTLRFRFPDVTHHGRNGDELWIDTALRDSSVGTRANVDMTIRLGEDSVTHRHRDRRGWQHVKVPRSLESQELVIEISADEPGRRHFCYRFDFR